MERRTDGPGRGDRELSQPPGAVGRQQRKAGGSRMVSGSSEWGFFLGTHCFCRSLGFLSRVCLPLPFSSSLSDLEVAVGWLMEFESWLPLTCFDSSARDSISSLFWFLTFFNFYFYTKNILYGSIADIQCCGSFRWIAKGLSHTCTCMHFPPQTRLPSRLPHNIEWTSMC